VNSGLGFAIHQSSPEFIDVAVTVAVNQAGHASENGQIVFEMMEASAGFEPAVEVLQTWVSWRLGLLESRDHRGRLSVMVALLEFGWREVARGAV
jgi:hypothetical protein